MKKTASIILTVMCVFCATGAFGQSGPAMGAAPKADGSGVESSTSGWSESGTADVAVPAAKTPAGPQIITDIQINGLRHTRQSFMMQVLKRFKGMDAQELELSDVETTLRALDIFSETECRLEAGDAGAVLVIDVKEKISFVPLPFFAVSEEKPMGGIFVMDTNASGMKNTYVLGGIISTNFLMGISMYNKPSLSLTQPGFALSASGFKGETTFTSHTKEELLSYDSQGFTVSAQLVDKLTDHSTASLGLRYQFRNFDVDEGYGELDNIRALSMLASYGQQYVDWNGWFLSQKMAGLNAEYGFAFGMDHFQKVGSDALFQHPFVFDRLRMLIHGGAAKLYHGHPGVMMNASSVGISILPSDFNTDCIMGATAGFEFAFVKLKWTTLSVYGLYEVVRAEEWDNSFFVNQGFSFGSKMYLSKIAFPAMAFGFSQNLTEKITRASFSLGIGL